MLYAAPNYAAPPAAEGETQWRGVHERAARNPPSVPEGFLARGVNMRCRAGFPEPRAGDTILPWGPRTAPSAFAGPLGASVVSDPLHGGTTILVAATDGVWSVRPHGRPVAVPLPAGVTLDADTFAGFVQAFNVLYLLRGDRLPPLQCTNLAVGFTALDTPDATALALPNARFGLYFLDRLLAVSGLDYAWASDPDGAQFHFDSIFKVTEGDGDRLQALAAWGRDTLIAFKQHRVLLYTGAGAGPASATLQNGTDQYGLHGPRAVATAGREIYWLASRGVASLKLTELNESQAQSVLLSNDLSETFQRVHWAAAATCARLVFDDGYLHCALPVDGSAVNNLIAVYDCQNEAWAGYDATPAGVVDWLKLPIQGREQLAYLGTDGALHLRGGGGMDDTLCSYVTSGGVSQWVYARREVATEYLLRGYAGQDPRGKRYQGLRLSLQTWAPSLTLTTLGDQAGEERPARNTPLTRSPLASAHYAGAARTADNAGDDQAQAGWQDYSVDIPAASTHTSEDGTVTNVAAGLYLGPDTVPTLPQAGLNPDQMQAVGEFIPLAQDAPWLQVRLVNTAGRVALRSALLVGHPVNEARATR